MDTVSTHSLLFKTFSHQGFFIMRWLERWDAKKKWRPSLLIHLKEIKASLWDLCQLKWQVDVTQLVECLLSMRQSSLWWNVSWSKTSYTRLMWVNLKKVVKLIKALFPPLEHGEGNTPQKVQSRGTKASTYYLSHRKKMQWLLSHFCPSKYQVIETLNIALFFA